jgi:hypothetical protein
MVVVAGEDGGGEVRSGREAPAWAIAKVVIGGADHATIGRTM